MPIYAGLLRAVNLGPRNKVAMRDLCQVLADAGMQEPRSLLQSGNVVFRSDSSSPAKLERLLEEAVAKHLDVKTTFYVRTAKEWKDVLADNPFPAEAKSDPSHLLVVFMKEPIDPAAVTALQKAITGPERVKAKGRHAYIVYPDGIGRSKLTAAIAEKHLGRGGTGRNWNTVVKLGALLGVTEKP